MTQAIATDPAASKPKRKSKYFFIRRRPKLRGVPRVWERPDEATYATLLKEEGFIHDDLLAESASDELKADCRELEQHLMPFFWRVNQEAKFFQNRYYLYQWIFILTAFLTTAFSAWSVYLHGSDGDASLAGLGLTGLLGVLAAIVSGMATIVSFLNANVAPQARWFKARAQAESLRSMYFVFLARQKPFTATAPRARLDALRGAVVDVMRESQKEGTVR